ncbi:phosphoribosyltransferase family protein [Streptomyces sp. NBC_01275]|uniref:phosphoribosyltransferase n=1 Tax=Streptomyces sp. NBC_01275 TaxID=2903807 RepID=UPI00225074EF|nr:phosphoribosyltransferase family protein [Streptomyces sp. NBC_01275]MCX4763630.1 phosphoribosyltransferase family protein [Streptomyces sp. NBC_01275]
MPELSEEVKERLVFRAARDRASRMVSWAAVQRDVDALAEAIHSAGVVPTALIGIFQGGWLVAQCLADHFPGAPVLGCLARQGDDEARVVLFGATDGLHTEVVPEPGSTALLVDEVVDSGRTAGFYLERLRDDFGVHAHLVCLAADTAARPAPDFAAQRMDSLPALVLPWRVLRDFEQTAACLLRAEPMTTSQIDERLREFGHDIAPRVLDARLRSLAARGLVRLGDDGTWSRGGA